MKYTLHQWESANGFNDEIFYTHANHLGSASWITDRHGEPIEYIHYAPYGELLAIEHNGNYREKYLFTGKERDEETGLDYFGARYYDSRLGFWMSVDPLADKYPNVTPYLYCNGNPVMLVDPDGRKLMVSSANSRKMLMEDLSLVFGADRMRLVAYDEKKGLQITDHKAFRSGLSKDQKQLYRTITKAIYNSQEIALSYSEKYKKNDGTIGDVNTEQGGGICNHNTNEITISPNPPSKLTDLTSDIFPFNSFDVNDNSRCSTLFHELKEFLLGPNCRFRGEAVDVENAARSLLNLSKRPYDSMHSFNVELRDATKEEMNEYFIKNE